MPTSWNTTTLSSENEVLQILLDLQGKRWLTRGHSKCHGALIPSIDRGKFEELTLIEKLQRERQSIDMFRSTARFFSNRGEQLSLVDDIVALMVLRHHGVPSRLLDWSRSPYVATYFAICDHDEEDGEIWSFNEPDYAIKGAKQWRLWPETTTDGSGDSDKFAAGLTAFKIYRPNWIIAVFYPEGFPRQNAQSGAYTMMAHFGIDHASKLRELLDNPNQHHRYIIKANLKYGLRTTLREKHGIWLGSLFPDTAGAALIARGAFPRPKPCCNHRNFNLVAEPALHNFEP